MEGVLQFGFLVSFVVTVALINLGMINFIRGNEKWKKNLQWSIIPIIVVCICIIAYPDASAGVNLP